MLAWGLPRHGDVWCSVIRLNGSQTHCGVLSNPVFSFFVLAHPFHCVLHCSFFAFWAFEGLGPVWIIHKWFVAGVIVSVMNMMSYEACKAAVTVFDEDKTQTIVQLEEYAVDHMVFRPLLWWMYYHLSERYSLPFYYSTSSGDEMALQAMRSRRADLTGQCYSQSLFNTAVLRLCGFPPEEVFTVGMPLHAVTIFRSNGSWHVFDSTLAGRMRMGLVDSLVQNTYNTPGKKGSFFHQ